ncbi:hypothetical protein J3459_017841 [Metarhizium acridum]|nr:hypothetical protein J3459_017841 [Metarhizium acridum]
MSIKTEAATYTQRPSCVGVAIAHLAHSSQLGRFPVASHQASHDHTGHRLWPGNNHTVDLAGHVPEGRVIGLERAAKVLEQARALAADKGVENIEFTEGDANSLSYPDDTFDIVFCHQVLQHVQGSGGNSTGDATSGQARGIVAARESDYGAFTWYP